MKKVVVIGGGTGSFTVLSGLKKYPLDLTAIVTVADSGGSTGRLRDEFGTLPVGDFRMALVALADDENSDILRRLFLHRFDKGNEGLKGHNFGNLFLVAMADLLGSYEAALAAVSKILNIKGRVLPITDKDIQLVASYEDGSVMKGETHIDEPPEHHDGTQRIKELWIEPEAPIAKEAMGAILSADFIVIGPGDLYTSLLANIVVSGTSKALLMSNAKIIYVGNLMTKYGQTHGFTATDHVNELSKYMSRTPDYVIINRGDLPERILKKYKEEQDFEVEDDLNGDFKVVRADILVPREVVKPSGDAIKRSLIRHDPEKLAWQIVKLINDEKY